MQFNLFALAAFFAAAIAAPSPANDNANPIEARRATADPTGQCEGAGNACSGVASYWEGGLGACGWNVNTQSDLQIALPHGLMGTRSDDNPYCNRQVTISVGGKTVQAKVGDKCTGCEGTKIDLTEAVFQQFAGLDVGILQGVTWYFN